MANLSRRAFVEGLAGVSTLVVPSFAFGATTQQCVTGGLPGFLPNSLSVDCASKRNFQAFRQNAGYLGLAGVVSMTSVRGAWGSYPAGNLFLFPWLKRKGQALKDKTWPALIPLNATQVTDASPIPNSLLPVDEYLCRVVLQVPWTSFIGFELDNLTGKAGVTRAWGTDISKLADGQGITIDWTSANLNNPWFGGSRWIPGSDVCNGMAWRQLIIAAVEQASIPAC